MNQIVENYVSQLNGYLRAYQRMRGENFAFGAKVFTTREQLEEFITEITKTKPEYDVTASTKVLSEIESIVFSGILSDNRFSDKAVSNYIRKMFVEDFIDYFDLLPFAQGVIEGRHFRFCDAKIYVLANGRPDDKASYAFWLEINEHYIFTYFRLLHRR
jgi:hypothetical protein